MTPLKTHYTASPTRMLAMAIAAALIGTTAQAASDFPGGEPITLDDLTATPPVLPAAPPAYDAQNDSPNHEEFARFAWREFIYFNSPAEPVPNAEPGQTTVVRGVVDPNGNFVTSGAPSFYADGKSSTDNFSKNILVWESFAHRSELFPKESTPTGDFQSLAPEYVFTNLTVPSTQARFNNLDENSQIGQNKIFFPANGSTPSTNPYDDYEILFEAKVNQVEYDYVKSLNGKAPDFFNLPPNGTDNDETIEIKAAWRVMTQDLIDSGRYHTAEALYYTETQNGVQANVGTFGLVGLHIIRKMANYEAFVYATFEHVDNLKTPSGADSGLYFITLYEEMDYLGTAGPTPSAIINNGVNHILVALPTQGDVVAANGYPFIPGTYELPAGTAGPIKVVVPPTLTKAVADVNTEVKNLMAGSPQFKDSVWQYYTLAGVLPLPVDEDTSITGPNNPLTQDYFLANNVIESSQPGIQLFKGGAPGPVPEGSSCNPNGNNPPEDVQCFPNPRSGTAALNIQNVPGLGSEYNEVVMGGCMGCHGQSKYTNADSTVTSIFSFLINTDNLNGTGGFEADALNEADSELATKALLYMAP